MTLVEIDTKVALSNSGVGSWTASLTTGAERKELTGVDALTTRDRLALKAAISGLGALKRRCAVELYTESQYLVQGAVKWLPIWKTTMAGSREDSRDRIRNHDLWNELHAAASLHDIQWHYVVSAPFAQKGGVLGRTAGEGSDVGYLYCGDAPPWDASLEGYRTFTDAEKQDENSCYQIIDDDVSVKGDLRAIRQNVIAQIAQKTFSSRQPVLVQG